MRRGALLMEVLVALAIVVGVGAFSLQAVGGAMTALEHADQRRRCNDAAVAIVRMAQAGLVGIGDLRSESLPTLLDQSIYAGDPESVTLNVDTSPSAEPGLLLLHVTVSLNDSPVQASVRCLVPSDLRLEERVR